MKFNILHNNVYYACEIDRQELCIKLYDFITQKTKSLNRMTDSIYSPKLYNQDVVRLDPIKPISVYFEETDDVLELHTDSKYMDIEISDTDTEENTEENTKENAKGNIERNKTNTEENEERHEDKGIEDDKEEEYEEENEEEYEEENEDEYDELDNTINDIYEKIQYNNVLIHRLSKEDALIKSIKIVYYSVLTIAAMMYIVQKN